MWWRDAKQTCGLRCVHPKWSSDVKKLEKAWSVQQARKRELEEVRGCCCRCCCACLLVLMLSVYSWNTHRWLISCRFNAEVLAAQVCVQATKLRQSHNMSVGGSLTLLKSVPFHSSPSLDQIENFIAVLVEAVACATHLSASAVTHNPTHPHTRALSLSLPTYILPTPSSHPSSTRQQTAAQSQTATSSGASSSNPTAALRPATWTQYAATAAAAGGGVSTVGNTT